MLKEFDWNWSYRQEKKMMLADVFHIYKVLFSIFVKEVFGVLSWIH